MLVLTMLLVAVLTATDRPQRAVAALLPMTVVLAMRLGVPTSRMLMPLAFAGSAGGLLLLTGLAGERGHLAGGRRRRARRLRTAGIRADPVADRARGTSALIVLLGPRLLPDRTSSALPPNLSTHARTLVEHYSLDQVFHLRVDGDSPLVGRTRRRTSPPGRAGLRIITVLDGVLRAALGRRPPAPGRPADRPGRPRAEVEAFAAATGAAVESIRGATEVSSALLTRDEGVIEAVIPPRSRYLEPRQSIPAPSSDGAVVVLAVQRGGVDRGWTNARCAPAMCCCSKGPGPPWMRPSTTTTSSWSTHPTCCAGRAVPRGRAPPGPS